MKQSQDTIFDRQPWEEDRYLSYGMLMPIGNIPTFHQVFTIHSYNKYSVMAFYFDFNIS